MPAGLILAPRHPCARTTELSSRSPDSTTQADVSASGRADTDRDKESPWPGSPPATYSTLAHRIGLLGFPTRVTRTRIARSERAWTCPTGERIDDGSSHLHRNCQREPAWSGRPHSVQIRDDARPTCGDCWRPSRSSRRTTGFRGRRAASANPVAFRDPNANHCRHCRRQSSGRRGPFSDDEREPGPDRRGDSGHVRRRARRGDPELTAREREVLALLVLGKSTYGVDHAKTRCAQPARGGGDRCAVEHPGAVRNRGVTGPGRNC